MTPETLLIAALAVYRLTYMINAENGPADIFGRFRSFVGVVYDQYSNPKGTNWVSEGILCYYCLSTWFGIGTALALYFAPDVTRWVLLPFALSGVAVYLKKVAG